MTGAKLMGQRVLSSFVKKMWSELEFMEQFRKIFKFGLVATLA